MRCSYAKNSNENSAEMTMAIKTKVSAPAIMPMRTRARINLRVGMNPMYGKSATARPMPVWSVVAQRPRMESVDSV